MSNKGFVTYRNAVRAALSRALTHSDLARTRNAYSINIPVHVLVAMLKRGGRW
jgi:hypothetical protein